MSDDWVKSETSSVSDFISKIKSLDKGDDCFYTFRGETNIGWPVRPGIMRDGRLKLFQNERDAVRELVAVHPSEFYPDQTMFDRLVRMQHFNLPTRLLDVTASPLVALFNAVDDLDKKNDRYDGNVYYISVPNERRKFYDSDTVSCVSNLCNLSEYEKKELRSNLALSINDFNDPAQVKSCDRLLQFVRSEKPFFRNRINAKDLDTLWYVVPKMNNRRIIAQNGAFLIFGLSQRPPAPTDRKVIQFASIRVLKKDKEEIRNELKGLGMNRSILFPEIDKAADNIVEKYK